MDTPRILSDVLPEALAVALIDAGFKQFKTHARYKYLEAFIESGAASPTQALTRTDVQAYLETTYPDIQFNSARATSNAALRDLVEAGFLDCDTQTQTYRYWFVWAGEDDSQTAQCDLTANTVMTDGSGGDEPVSVGHEGTTPQGSGAVAPGEQHQRSAETSAGSAASDYVTTAGWRRSVVRLSQSWEAGWVTLLLFCAGGSVAFITVLLLRLAVPSPVVTTSAAVAWGLLSLGLAASVVLSVRSLMCIGGTGQPH